MLPHKSGSDTKSASYAFQFCSLIANTVSNPWTKYSHPPGYCNCLLSGLPTSTLSLQSVFHPIMLAPGANPAMVSQSSKNNEQSPSQGQRGPAEFRPPLPSLSSRNPGLYQFLDCALPLPAALSIKVPFSKKPSLISLTNSNPILFSHPEYYATLFHSNFILFGYFFDQYFPN